MISPRQRLKSFPLYVGSFFNFNLSTSCSPLEAEVVVAVVMGVVIAEEDGVD